MSPKERPAPLPGGWTLSLVRIVAGPVFINYGYFSKMKNPKFLAVMEETMRSIARHSALPWYRPFLERVAIPHASAFGLAVAWGEALLGVSLLAGAFCNPASLLGCFMLLNFFLATRSLDALLFASLCLLFLRLSAGSRWGLDGLLAKVLPARLVYFPRR